MLDELGSLRRVWAKKEQNDIKDINDKCVRVVYKVVNVLNVVMVLNGLYYFSLFFCVIISNSKFYDRGHW